MSSKRLCSIHKIRELQLPLIEIQEQYEVIKEIGSGDYGKVMLAVHRDTESQVALKAVPKITTPLKDFLIEFHYSYFLSPHNNILDTYDVAFETIEHYVFAQEVAPYGDVWQAIERTGGLEESDLKTVVRQITSALEFMHSKGLVHRDMRAENMLIFSEDFSRVKLTDFGLTRRTDTLVKKRTRSLPTCPPEIWEAVHLEGYTVEIGSDVWQMGMFVFAGLLARFPWEKADITDTRFSEFVQWQKRKITRTPKDFRRFTPRLHRLIRRLMDPKPSKRYEIKEPVLNNTYITDTRFSEFVQWQKRKITRTPKDFRRFTPRLHRLIRRLMDPKPSKRYEIKEVYKYLNDKWLICRSPRATTTVTKTDAADAVQHAENLGQMLTTLTVTRTTERRVSEWVQSNFDSDSDT